MSLNLRINRPKPRRVRRRQILWLLVAVLASIIWLSWQTGLRPNTLQLARFNQENLLTLVPVAIAETLPQPIPDKQLISEAEYTKCKWLFNLQ